MIVDIYQSNIHRNKFLVVPAGTQIVGKALNLEDASFSNVAKFNMGFPLQSGMIGLNATQAQADINAKGHHTFSIRIEITIDPK